MLATAAELAHDFGVLDAHDQGCRVRIMEWLACGERLMDASAYFSRVLTLGVIAWPSDEEVRRAQQLHQHIDAALED